MTDKPKGPAPDSPPDNFDGIEESRAFTSQDAIQYVAQQTDTCIVSYSGGKDSLALWLHCRYYFPRIVPIFHYMAPGLEFVDRYLDYAEKALNTRIIRVPHPLLYQRLARGAYQPPIEAALQTDILWWRTTTDEMVQVFRDVYGLTNAWNAVGTTKYDSANRALVFKKHGMVREAVRKFYPIGDWTKGDIHAVIRASGIKLPPDYRVFGRSFDRFDYPTLRAVQQEFPRDYQTLLKTFPLLRLEAMRYRMRQENPNA